MDLNKLNLRESLNKVKFLLANKELIWGDYEEISSELFFSPQITGKTNKIIIHPGGELMLIISIVITAFNDYIKNMIDPTNNIFEYLKYGDIVEVNGYRAKYKGASNDRVLLEYLDGTVSFPIDQSYKMIRYNGGAQTINKMPTKKTTKAKVTKDVVSSIFNIDTKEFSNIIKYSTVFVASKEKVYEIIRNLNISYDKKTYGINSIFPFAYYSSSDHKLDFAGNATKIEPIIKFASKISVARDLIQDNKDIKNVVIFGEESYRNNLTDLDWIYKRHSVDNTNIVFEWGKTTTIEGLLDNVENLEVYAWSKNAILNKVNLFDENNVNSNTSSATLYQRRIIYNFVDKEIEVININSCFDIQEKFTETRKMIKEISNSTTVDDRKDEFLKLSYTLINLYEKSCFPLKNLEKMIEEEQLIGVHPKQTIEKLNELMLYLRLYVFDNITTQKIEKIIENLSIFRIRLYENNPKWEKLLELVKIMQPNKTSLILYKTYFIDVLRKCFENENMQLNFNMYTVSKFNPDRTYDEIIMPGVYQSKEFDFINNSFTKKIKIITYTGEKNLFAWISRKNKQIVDKIESKNLLVECSEIKAIDEIAAVCEDDVKDIFEIDDIINNIIKKQGTFEGNYSGSISKTECVKMAIFESGEKAYFTRYYSPSLLDRDAEDIKDIKIEELSVGDELVFKKDERNINKDIIQVIIEKLLENEDFQKEYKESIRLSRYWKNALNIFMKKTGFDENNISAMLSNFNVDRSPMTVSIWLRSNKSTAPIEPDVYRALANIIKDQWFMENWENVCESCAVTRKLQTKLKKYLGRCIVKSVVNEMKTDFDRIVEACVGDVSKLAQIVQIEKLYDIGMEVPVHMTNRLIEL